jgi:hypothetical protein
MRFDDPARPISALNAVKTALQTNRSPLPTITLLYPMKEGSENEVDAGGNVIETGEWGWLACIHAHRTSNKFGTFYGWLRDLGQFQRDYLDDPENALLKYFKYSGPDYADTEHSLRPKQEITEDIFA